MPKSQRTTSECHLRNCKEGSMSSLAVCLVSKMSMSKYAGKLSVRLSGPIIHKTTQQYLMQSYSMSV